MQIKNAFKLLEEFEIPSNIVSHVTQVAKVAKLISDHYINKGFNIDVNSLICAAIVHDLYKLKARNSHSNEAYQYLKDKNEDKIALMVYKHDMEAIIDDSMQPFTLEEQILNYADKRVKHDEIVSLKERLADMKVRYNSGNEVTPWETKVYSAYYKLEKELFTPIDISPTDIKEENLKDL